MTRSRMGRRGWVLVAVGVALILLAGYLLYASLSALASNWAYEMTGLRDLQGQDLDGTGIVVAVIDTGIDPDHPSLDHIPIKAWKDFVNDRTSPYDDSGHGSHVSGILAGQGSTFAGKLQGLDMKGAAPAVSLIVVKAISKEGTGSSSDVAEGIKFATQRDADIICMSLGSQPGLFEGLVSSDIEQAVDAAVNRGIVVVAAAGNTGEKAGDAGEVQNPAAYDNVIAVGAVDDDKRVADFSSRGDLDANYGPNGPTGRISSLATNKPPNQKPELVAPGVRIQSAWKDGGYVRADGTSQAAPFVCGAVALLLQAKPTLRSDNTSSLASRVKTALMNSSEKIPDQQTPHDPLAGYGLLRADRLVQQFA